ncbi:MAG: hypothetical protein ACOCX1_04560 [Fimbriimonadaceae bacterium]
MLSRWFALVALPLVVLAGCTNVSSESELRADGTLLREITLERPLEVPSFDEEGPKPIEEYVTFFQPGEWEIDTRKDGDQQSLVASRNYPPEAVVENEFELLGEDGAIIRVSLETRELENGDLEYIERYTWIGEDPAGFNEADFEEAQASIGPILDEIGATTAQKEDFYQRFQVGVIRATFGPNEPIIGNVFNTPLLEKQLKLAVAENAYAALGQSIPGLAPATRTQAVEAMLEALPLEDELDVNSNPAGGTQEGEEEESDEASFAITVTVTGPGEIVETNGIANRFDNSVSWSFYDPSVSFESVELRVVFRP